MKFNVRVRIMDPYKRAHHKEQIVEAETGLDAMKKAQDDPNNTSRGLVQCQGADPLPLEDDSEEEDEGPAHKPHLIQAEPYDYPPPPKPRGRPPKNQTTPTE